jgi:hypothetical protein
LCLRYTSTFTLLWFRVWFIFLGLQQHRTERALELTDSFTWKDMPTRDADTGHLTASGRIPFTMKYSVRVAIAGLCVHIVQSTIRIVKKHETMLVAWYPFDWTVSPFYELVNISQVIISKTEFSYISSYRILNITLCFNWYFSLYLIFSFILYFFFLNFQRCFANTGRW